VPKQPKQVLAPSLESLPVVVKDRQGNDWILEALDPFSQEHPDGYALVTNPELVRAGAGDSIARRELSLAQLTHDYWWEPGQKPDTPVIWPWDPEARSRSAGRLGRPSRIYFNVDEVLAKVNDGEEVSLRAPEDFECKPTSVRIKLYHEAKQRGFNISATIQTSRGVEFVLVRPSKRSKSGWDPRDRAVRAIREAWPGLQTQDVQAALQYLDQTNAFRVDPPPAPEVPA
jgi:hypothetical protein